MKHIRTKMGDYEPVNKCASCDLTLKGEILKCEGLCNKIYHAKCVNCTTTNFKFIEQSTNIIFRCDECMLKPDVMIYETMKKILSFMCMTDERMNRLEKSNEKLCKEMVYINESVKRMSEHIVMDKDSEINGKQLESYASVTKNKYDEAVVIKPKKNQGSDVTRSEMNGKLLIPHSVNISGVKNIPKGGVVINCNNQSDVKIIEDEVNKKMGEEYSVYVPTKRNPKIKVTNISENLSEAEISENIKMHNEFMKSSTLKIIKVYENKKMKNYGAIIEIDPVSFNEVIERKKLRIGLNICNVME